MLNFGVNIVLAGCPVTFQVEELNLKPDESGYVRYHVQGDGRVSVISIDKSYWERPFIVTEKDAWDYYEKIHYPESELVFCGNQLFSHEELELIRRAIGKKVNNIKP